MQWSRLNLVDIMKLSTPAWNRIFCKCVVLHVCPDRDDEMQQMHLKIEQAVETPFSLVILSSAVVSVKESEVRVGALSFSR